MTNKPLPTICPECGAKGDIWRHGVIHTYTFHGEVIKVSATACKICGCAAEFFQDTEALGRRKFIPVEG